MAYNLLNVPLASNDWFIVQYVVYWYLEILQMRNEKWEMRMQQCQMIVLLFLNSMQVPWPIRLFYAQTPFYTSQPSGKKGKKWTKRPKSVCASAFWFAWEANQRATTHNFYRQAKLATVASKQSARARGRGDFSCGTRTSKAQQVLWSNRIPTT